MSDEFHKNMVSESFKRLINAMSLPSLAVAVAAFGISGFFLQIDKAVFLSLAVFGILGAIEIAYRNKHAHFNKLINDYNAIHLGHNRLFLELIDKLHRHRVEFVADKLKLNGILFKNIKTDKPTPTTAIAGPLCPECEHRITFRAYPIFPWWTQYTCACGFKCLLKESPDQLYKMASYRYNLLV